MKLTRININGFKSFADNTVIEINDGITAIVGPNGSGKSNIVDAVKWALGDQSVKDIRGGDKMSDLIFSGSSARKSQNRAWVSLTFDNSDYYLKTKYQEVEVKRVIYKSGDNEYYINNERVRLKDVTNLFIDSGTTVNSLSIISQGKVNEIINSRANERRFILEEAAGVLKYKKRKEESIRKLDRTEDNLKTIDLLIEEISLNLKPLKKQSEDALNYNKYKDNLKDLEISLFATEIKEMNDKSITLKDDLSNLEIETTNLIKTKNNSEHEINKLLLKKYNIEEDINKLSVLIDNHKNNLRRLESEKQIMMERKKYEVSSSILNQNAIIIKEKALEAKNELESEENHLELLKEEINKNNTFLNDVNNSLNEKLDELNNIDKNLNIHNIKINEKNEKIEKLNQESRRHDRAPYFITKLINSNTKGIDNVLRNVIKVDNHYREAINTALGYSLNIVIADNFKASEKGINYLKKENLGRATFFPLDTIKPRFIKENLSEVSSIKGYVDVASNLVSADIKYSNIINNLLGNVIISRDLSSGEKISKKVNYKYKVVTLNGDIINAGGSLTGGYVKTRSVFNNEITKLRNTVKTLKENINELNQNEENLKYEVGLLENNKKDITLATLLLEERITYKESQIRTLINNKQKLDNELKGTEGLINNTIGDEIEKLVNEFYKVKEELNANERELTKLKTNLTETTLNINKLEDLEKESLNKEKSKLNEINNIKLQINECDFKMDNLLLSLNEKYNMTYEFAVNNYNLDINIDKSKKEARKLKTLLSSLDEVNLGAPKEYERVKTRYDFLTSQKEDLEESINNILNVIKDLDEVMKEKLEVTYNELNEEFKKTFNKLFQGGEASLKLVGDDILTSGLEIEAVPPGKDIKSTKILSGGELALTAIALLFSILNIRTVPYSILDEVEAALDEDNVNRFGQYINKLNTKTQFVLITHKKKTMEFADTLYGITMEESGVSKVVSVKLD